MTGMALAQVTVLKLAEGRKTAGRKMNAGRFRMRSGVFARRVGQAADKPRRPIVLELHTWWADVRVARWSRPARPPLLKGSPVEK